MKLMVQLYCAGHGNAGKAFGFDVHRVWIRVKERECKGNCVSLSRSLACDIVLCAQASEIISLAASTGFGQAGNNFGSGSPPNEE